MITSGQVSMQLVFDEHLKSNEIFMSPRVGLNAKMGQAIETYVHYQFMLLRYSTEPNETKKGKVLLFLYQAIISGREKAIESLGIREIEAQKYLSWFNSGKQMKIENILTDTKNSIQKLCKLYGSYLAYCEQFPTLTAAYVFPFKPHFPKK